VADDPPAALVERLAEVFLDTGGDLGEVTRALFTSPEFYDEANRDNRTKPPFTLVASALRVTGAWVDNPAAVMELLTQLGQAPYLASAPTGYPEESAAWESAGATVHRANFGLALASGRLRGVRVDPEVVRGLAFSGASRSPSTSGEGLARLAAGLVDASSPGATGLERERTVDAVRAALGDADGGLTPGSLAAALGLVLASPTFQKH
jgi:hypothetical protein